MAKPLAYCHFVKSLLALDLALGPELEAAVRDAFDADEAFCVLDQRVSPRQRREQLALLGATAVRDRAGRSTVTTGTGVDDEIQLVMLTSGSAGAPKAVELSRGALVASATLTTSALSRGRDAVWYPCLPANHIGGLAVMLRAILADARLVWGDPSEVESAPDHGATHVAVVRAQVTRFDLTRFDVVLLGGAKPPFDVAPNVVTTWGMTETGSGIVYDRRALEGVDVVSVSGELCVRSPTLFRSYRGEARPSVVGPDGRDDWFPTGDAGEVVDGLVSVRGRIGFVINTGGEKVWPEDLEALLSEDPRVRDVAVTGVDDAEWGQRIVALVVSDGQHFDQEIAAIANDHIGPWAKPKEIRYVAAIPRTNNGKIRRLELPNLY